MKKNYEDYYNVKEKYCHLGGNKKLTFDDSVEDVRGSEYASRFNSSSELIGILSDVIDTILCLDTEEDTGFKYLVTKQRTPCDIQELEFIQLSGFERMILAQVLIENEKGNHYIRKMFKGKHVIMHPGFYMKPSKQFFELMQEFNLL